MNHTSHPDQAGCTEHGAGEAAPSRAYPAFEAAAPATRTGRRGRGPDWRVSVGTLTGALGLVVAAHLVARSLVGDGVRLYLGRAAWPLFGHYAPRLDLWLVPALLVAVAAVVGGPWVVARLPWRALLTMTAVAAAGWAVSLGVAGGGVDALAAPLTSRHDYLHDVDRVTDLGAYLRTFTDYIVDRPRWTTHVSGHPPGALGIFVLLDRAGLAGAGWAAVLCITGGAAAAPAVLATVKLLAGEEYARRAALFVTFAPTALWVATSADAFFAGVAAWGIYAVAAGTAQPGRRGYARALGGGLLLGCCLLLSYGLTLLGPLALAVVLLQRQVPLRRRLVVLAVGAGAVVALLAGMAAAGFWWFEGLELTAQRVRTGSGWLARPAWYFLFANAAAVVIAVGPATVVGLARAVQDVVRRVGDGRPLAGGRPLVVAAMVLLAMTIATASGLSKGEVERIYLPFSMWLLPLAAFHAAGVRGWVAAQCGVAIAVETALDLGW